MSKISISREEYKNLKKQSEAYKTLATRFFETAIKDSTKDVVKDFLSDLENGLRKSSYSG